MYGSRVVKILCPQVNSRRELCHILILLGGLRRSIHISSPTSTIVSPLILEGNILLREGKVSSAIELYKKTRAICFTAQEKWWDSRVPPTKYVTYNLATALQLQGDLDQAKDLFQSLIDPDYKTWWGYTILEISIVSIEMLQGNVLPSGDANNIGKLSPEEAISKLTARDPTHLLFDEQFKYYFTLSLAYYLKGEFDLALQQFNKAIENMYKSGSENSFARSPRLTQRTIMQYRDLLNFRIKNESFAKDAINTLCTNLRVEYMDVPSIESSSLQNYIPIGKQADLLWDDYSLADEVEWMQLVRGLPTPAVVAKNELIAVAESNKSEIHFWSPQAAILTGIYTKSTQRIDFEYIPLQRQELQQNNLLEPQKPDNDSPETVANLLKNAKYAVVFTGYDASTEDIFLEKPTWQKINQASIWNYFYNPSILWNQIKDYYSRYEHTTNYEIIAELEKLDIIKAVVTCNISGLHKSVGTKNVIEMYGSISQVRCTQCDQVFDKPSKGYLESSSFPPSCDHFGQQGKCTSHSLGTLRPNIVFLEEEVEHNVAKAALEQINKCDLLLVIGTDRDSFLASELPLIAKRNGAKIVTINKNASRVSQVADASYSYTRETGEFLRKVLKILKSG